MSWIASHQEVARHPKTKRLARLLSVSMPTAIGVLHLLWWWCLDFAEDGDLSRYSADDLADGLGWDGDAAGLVDALVASGFVDRARVQDDLAMVPGLFVHDWQEHAGKLLDQRKAARERAKKSAQRNAARAPRAGSAKATRSLRVVEAQPARLTGPEPEPGPGPERDADASAPPSSPPDGGESPPAPRKRGERGQRGTSDGGDGGTVDLPPLFAPSPGASEVWARALVPLRDLMSAANFGWFDGSEGLGEFDGRFWIVARQPAVLNQRFGRMVRRALAEVGVQAAPQFVLAPDVAREAAL